MLLTFMTWLSLGNIISSEKRNTYSLGLLTRTHLKVFTKNLEARLVPGNSLWKDVMCLGQVAGLAAHSSFLSSLNYNDLTDTKTG